MKFVKVLKAAMQRAEVSLDLILIGIAHMTVEIEPSEQMWGTLNKRRPKLNFGKILRSDIVRQYRLSGLPGEDDYRQLASAELLAVLEHLEVLKILDIDSVERYLASRDLGPQTLLQLITFRPCSARGLMEALVSYESRRA
jgi:hypothetical protein